MPSIPRDRCRPPTRAICCPAKGLPMPTRRDRSKMAGLRKPACPLFPGPLFPACVLRSLALVIIGSAVGCTQRPMVVQPAVTTSSTRDAFVILTGDGGNWRIQIPVQLGQKFSVAAESGTDRLQLSGVVSAGQPDSSTYTYELTLRVTTAKGIFSADPATETVWPDLSIPLLWGIEIPAYSVTIQRR